MKQFPRSSGITSNLSDSVHQHLNMYALAAGAAGVGLLALAQKAEAKIVYTPTHHKLTNGQFPIDFNHDGIVDFLLIDQGLYKTSNTTSCSFCGQYLNVMGNGNVGAGVVSRRGEAAALAAGAVIGPRDPFLNVQGAGLLMASAFNDDNSFFNIYGYFANKSKRFLGLKFEVNGKTHYGWARLALVNAGFTSVPFVTAVVNGYAYETTPNKPIIAGETSGPIVEDSAVQASPAVHATPAPEPATLGLLAMGAPGLSIWRREEDN